MTSKNLWASFYNERLHWAERARTGFAEGMPPAFRERILAQGSRTDIPVAVYGPSQVGKTSLILQLMGIRPEAEAEVGRVLRGRTRIGQASTATLMVYRRSSDAQYRLFRPGEEAGEAMDAAGMEAALAEVRATVEAEKVPEAWLKAPFRVELPEPCFLPDTGSAIQILDLPGDDSANALERAHVEALINAYTALATTILMVTASHNLRALDNPAREALRGWYRRAHRCRLVITYALSAHSVWKAMPSAGGSGEQVLVELRDHYRSEFSPDRPDLDPELRIYPLEYGTSWAQASREVPGFQQRFGAAMGAQMQALRRDLSLMASPHNRILSVLNGEAIIHTALEEASAAARSLHAEVVRCKAALASALELEKGWRTRCDKTRARLGDETLPEIVLPEPPATYPQDVPEFQQALKGHVARLKAAASHAMKGFEGEFGFAECREALKPLLEALDRRAEPFFAKLDGYFWSFYRKRGSDFKLDTERLGRLRREAPVTLAAGLAAWVQGLRKELNLPVRKDLRRYQDRLRLSGASLQAAADELKAARRRILKTARSRSGQRRELRAARARFAVFETLLDREALAARNQLVHAMNLPATGPALRFLNFLQLHQLSHDRAVFRSAGEAQT